MLQIFVPGETMVSYDLFIFLIWGWSEDHLGIEIPCLLIQNEYLKDFSKTQNRDLNFLIPGLWDLFFHSLSGHAKMRSPFWLYSRQLPNLIHDYKALTPPTYVVFHEESCGCDPDSISQSDELCRFFWKREGRWRTAREEPELEKVPFPRFDPIIPRSVLNGKSVVYTPNTQLKANRGLWSNYMFYKICSVDSHWRPGGDMWHGS